MKYHTKFIIKEIEIIKIIKDIIKIYLFIKDYIYKSKLYIDSNKKNVFQNLKKN